MRNLLWTFPPYIAFYYLENDLLTLCLYRGCCYFDALFESFFFVINTLPGASECALRDIKGITGV